MNPTNQCQYCNIASSPTSWTNYPTQPCDDGNSCTRDDTCNAGTCSGTDFTSECDVHTVATNPCVSGTYCDGSNCLPTYYSSSRQCYTNQDACDYPNLFCSGSHAECRYCMNDGTCTSVLSTKKPTTDVDPTNAVISVFESTSSSQLLSLVQGTDGKSYLMLPNNREMKMRFEGFKVPCGNVRIDWQLVDRANSDAVVYSSTGQIEIASETIHDVTVTNQFTLTNGGTYRVDATAKNVRDAETAKKSDEIFVDVTAPVIGVVYDGSRPGPNQVTDIDYQSGINAVSIHWDPNTIEDPESGIDTDSYRIAVGTSAGSTNIEDFVSSATGEITGLTLTHGTTYYVTLRVYNRAGLFTIRSSDGVTVDTTAPVAGAVTIVNSTTDQTQRDYFTSPSRRFAASLKGCNDPESGIRQMSWTMCSTNVQNSADTACNTAGYQTYSCADFNDCLIDITFSPSDRILLNGNFQSGYSYTLSLSIENEALLTSSVDSNAVIADYDAPLGGTVYDGLITDIDYQHVNTSISVRWFGFRDEQSGLDYCQLAVRRTSPDVIVLPFGNVALSRMTTKPLDLAAETVYSVTVRCFDKAGFYTDVTSDGVFIDPYPPVATEIADIRYEDNVNDEDEDRDFQVQQTGVKSKWKVFPSASGLASCFWSLGSTRNELQLGDIVPEQSILTTSTSYTYTIALSMSTTYFAAVRCTSRAGLSTTSISDGIAVDTSVPTSGAVYDLCPDPCGLTTDIEYSPSNTALKFRWDHFTDSESGIEFYEWNYDQDCTGFYILSEFEPVGLVNEVFSNQSLDHNVQYCVTVQGVNGAGLKVASRSNGVLIDTTSPRNVVVRDGNNPSTDIDYQSSSETVSFTWSQVTDPESGIALLHVGLGSSPGDNDIVPPTTISNVSTSHSFSNLRLEQNNVYYALVCATNGARLRTCVNSDGILIDTTSPKTGVVIHGAVQPGMMYQADDSKIIAHWYGFRDLQSSVDYFEWAIGTSPSATDVQVYTAVGSNVTFEADLPLENGQQYFVSVICYNGAGLQIADVSDGVTVDITAPVTSEMTISLTWPRSPFGIIASWENFTDAESPIWYYKWSVGTTKCGTQSQVFTNVGTRTTASNFMITFVSGLTYYSSVVARNRAGLLSKICSDGLLFDDSPPIAGIVRDGDGTTDVDFQTQTTTYSLNWDEFEDDESGLGQCSVGIGTSNDSADIRDFVNVGKGVTRYRFTNVQLRNGIKYYGIVRCNNTNELETTALSNGVTIDTTPPTPGDVRTIRFQTSLTSIEATWDTFTDTESSIDSYWLSISSHSPQDTLPFTNVKLNTFAVHTGLNLTANTTYVVTVRAFNRAGLSSVASSEGLVIDLSPPRAGIVFDGISGADIDWWYSARGIGSRWTGFTDDESSIVSYRWSIGTNVDGCQVLAASDVTVSTSAECDSCSFIPGSKYIITVEATNGAGLKSVASSDGFVVDLTDPDSGSITSLTWISNDILRAHWSGASDPDSGPPGCSMIAMAQTGWSIEHQLVGFEQQTVDFDISGYAMTDKVNVYVNCSNMADLTASSARRSIDASPPKSGSISLVEFDDSSFTMEWKDYQDPQSAIESMEIILLPSTSNSSDTVFVQPQMGSFYTFISAHNLYESSMSVSARAINLVGLFSAATAEVFTFPSPSNVLSEGDCCDVTVNYSETSIGVSWDWKNEMNTRSSELGYEYRYSIGSVPGGAQILRYTAVGTERNATCSDCVMIQGSYYHVSIHASLDNFATYIDVQSSPVLIDLTPPVSGDVVDEDFYAINATFTASWNGFYDPESAVDRCTVSIALQTSLESVWERDVASNGAGTISVSVDTWTHGSSYLTVLTCYSEKFSTSKSDGFTVDGTPPSGGSVSFSITGVESGMTAVAGFLTDFHDDESGIASYHLTLINQKGDSVFNEDVGQVTSFSASLNLTTQIEYQVIVRARNKAKLDTYRRSAWVMHDTTAPVASYIYDGVENYDLDFQLSIEGYSASWGRMTDNETKIVDCLWYVGTAPGGSQLMRPQSVGLSTEGSCTHCTMSPGMTYYSTVSCYNAAGYRTVISSDGILIDTTSPVSGNVYDGKGKQDKMYQSETSFVDCSWDSFIDAESGVTEYSVCLGSSAGLCDVHVKTESINSAEWQFSNLILEDKRIYYCSVYGTNGAGLSSVSTSDGVTVDMTSPVAGHVIEGREFDYDCQYSDEPIVSSWFDFYDRESGIAFYEWGIGKSIGSDDVIPFTWIGLNQTMSMDVDPGESGSLVFVTIRAQNEAGGKSNAVSDGVQIFKRGGDLPSGCVSFGA